MKLTRTLALLVCVLSLFFSSAAHVAAQVTSDWFKVNTSVEKNVDSTIKAVIDSTDKGTPSSESYVDDTFLNVQTSALIFFIGPPAKYLESDAKVKASDGGPSEEEKRIVSERYGRGAIGEVTNAIGFLYNPPASTGTYVADVLHSAHIIPQAQAQGLGFSALDPILQTWKVFRNIAYLFFVVIFLVIGFMIMFRQKISGQTVVTAQQAIPGVIVSLVFVTFSYAIAGFLIDVMYLLMYLIIGLFQPPAGLSLLDKSIFGAFYSVFIGEGAEGGERIAIYQSVNDAVKELTAQVTSNLGSEISGTLGFIGGITAALVVAIAILIAAFKIFFELLKTYLAIVLAIATAPLTLMLGAIPGRNNFIPWIKTVAGNLMAFPVVLMCFVVYDLFISGISQDTSGFLPPYLLGSGSSNAIVALVGIGILLVIPDLIKEVKKIFGAEGGIWNDLLGKALTAARDDGARWAVPAAYTVGGLGWDAAGAINKGRRDAKGNRLETTLSEFYDRVRERTPGRFRSGLEFVDNLRHPGDIGSPERLERMLRHGLTSEQRQRAHEREENRKKTTGKKSLG